MRKSLLIAFLMIIMVFGFALANISPFGTVQAATDVTGILYSDTTWTKANSPYTLTGPVAVNSGVTLMIEAGVTVNLGDYYIQVNGTLVARGSSTDKIQFNGGKSASIDFKPVSNGWNEQTGSGSIIEFAILNSTRINLNNASPKINSNSITIFASMLESNVGISSSGGSPVISNNNIEGGITVSGSAVILNNIMTGGMGVYGGSPVISNNKISGGESYFYIGRNWDRDYDVIAIVSTSSPAILNNEITGNSNGIGFDVYDGGSNNYAASVSGNIIYGCGAGINFGTYGEGTVTVSNNIIYNCGSGIRFGNGGLDTLTIEKNLIINNTDGMKIGSLTAAIRENSIAKNSVGISIESAPSSTIINNNIQDNTQYSIKLLQGVSNNVDATYNWWGTTDAPVINQTIFDNKRDFNLGAVNFVPFLTAPNSAAPAIIMPTPTPTTTPLPSPEIPEFPSWIILSLLVTATLAMVTVEFRRKRSLNR